MAHDTSEVRRALMTLEFLRKRYLRGYLTDIAVTLGQGQPRILEQLLKTNGISQRELAEACSMEVTTLSRTLDRMAEAGWVERLPSPESRRAFLIVLTTAGQAKAAQIKQGLEAEDAMLCLSLTDEELDTLLSLLGKLRRNLEAGGTYFPDAE